MKNLTQILSLILICLGISTYATGQQYELNPEIQERMKQLSFLEGKWEGSGWRLAQDQKKYTFNQTEDVSFQRSGTHLQIEGIGISDGKVVHHAIAMISPTKDENRFEFASYLQSGQKGNFKAEMKEGKFYWYPNEQVRYIITLNEKGQWFEIGEYNMGDRWFQFFEMTLDKIE